MVSIPTSLFGVVGFLILAGFLFAEFEGSNPNSQLNKVSADTNKQFANIQSLQNNQSSDWLSGITNTANIIGSVFIVILNYVSLPFGLTASFILSVAGLPIDLAPIVTVFLGVAVVAGIAIFIRRG